MHLYFYVDRVLMLKGATYLKYVSRKAILGNELYFIMVYLIYNISIYHFKAYNVL